MPFEIVKNDITRMRVDAIVNAANNSLLGGGGVDGAIHRAAGPELLEECRALGGCETGEAKLTRGYALPCKYVIHTVGPIWRGGSAGEPALLAACYRNALALARQNGCDSVAFPLISSGVYGYPKAQALQVAVEEITRFLAEADMMVYLVAYTRDAIELTGSLYGEITAYIDDVYVQERHDFDREARRSQYLRDGTPRGVPQPGSLFRRPHREDNARNETVFSEANVERLTGMQGDDPSEAQARAGESFAEMVTRKLGERGMTDEACARRANLDRRLFGKIRNNAGYRPARQTALALALALELSLDEAKALLTKAGFALSHARKMDIAVEYCLMTGHTDVDEINGVLFKLDLQQLGY